LQSQPLLENKGLAANLSPTAVQSQSKAAGALSAAVPRKGPCPLEIGGSVVASQLQTRHLYFQTAAKRRSLLEAIFCVAGPLLRRTNGYPLVLLLVAHFGRLHGSSHGAGGTDPICSRWGWQAPGAERLHMQPPPMHLSRIEQTRMLGARLSYSGVWLCFLNVRIRQDPDPSDSRRSDADRRNFIQWLRQLETFSFHSFGGYSYFSLLGTENGNHLPSSTPIPRFALLGTKGAVASIIST
jgi:hypothetical protein